MDGFRFAGKHSLDDWEIYALPKQRPLFAEPKVTVEEVSAVDGEFDYSRMNPQGRLFFKPRLLEYECHFVGEDEDEESFARKAREIAAWLVTAGEARLEPDDESDVFYLARAMNLYQIQSITPYSGYFPLVFRCQPYRFARRMTQVDAENVGDGSEVAVSNPGYFVAPVITVSGTAPDGFSLTCNNRTLHVGQALDGASVTVDMEHMTVTKDGLPATHTADGTFFELAPGQNEITVTGTGLSLQVSVAFRVQYV